MTTPSQPKIAFYTPWTEYESGWGNRPDGCSLHLTRDDYKHFLTVSPEILEKDSSEYSSPSGTLTPVEVTDSLYEKLTKCKSIRCFKHMIKVTDGSLLEFKIEEKA